MSKAPAFQFYSGDFLTGTALMSNAEVGLYIRLLCLQAEHGAIPDDVDRIAQAYGEQSRALWPEVRSKFIGGTTAGTLVNERLSVVLEARNAFRMKQSAKGKASAASRTSSGSTTVQPRFNHGSTAVEPLEDEVEEVLVQKRKERAHEPEIIPPGISSELWEAVKRWDKHRIEKRNKLTPSTRAAFLKKCAEWGDARSIAAIDHSIGQGYTGCFEPKDAQQPTKPQNIHDYAQRVAADVAQRVARYEANNPA